MLISALGPARAQSSSLTDHDGDPMWNRMTPDDMIGGGVRKVSGWWTALAVTLIAMAVAAPAAAPKPPSTLPADPAIAYRLAGTTDKLMVMNADGTNKAAVYSCTNGFVAGFSWSPDGKSIAFQPCSRGLWRVDVSVVNGKPVGSNAVQLADSSVCGSCYDAAWSPTGDVIAVSGGVSIPSMFLIPAGGGAAQVLYTASAGPFVLFSPPGSPPAPPPLLPNNS